MGDNIMCFFKKDFKLVNSRENGNVELKMDLPIS